MAMQARRALGLLTHACMQCVTEQDDAFNQGMQDMQSMFASVTSRDSIKGARKRHIKATKREQIGFGKSCEKCRKAKTKCSGDRPCARCLRLDVSVHVRRNDNMCARKCAHKRFVVPASMRVACIETRGAYERRISAHFRAFSAHVPSYWVSARTHTGMHTPVPAPFCLPAYIGGGFRD